jgi:hypothetical protein
MAITDTGSATGLLANILQEAMFTASERSIAGGLVTVYDMTATPGLVAQVPVYPEISADDLTDGGDLSTIDSIDPASVTITAAEIGVRADITDLLAESSAQNLAQDVGTMIGNSIGEKLDTNVFAQFDSITQVINTAGATAGAITVDDVLNAVYTLRGQNAPTDADGDYNLVVAPSVAFSLASALAGAGFQSGGATALSQTGNDMIANSAYMGRIFNVKVFMSTGVSADSASDSIGCLFSPQAFGHVIKRPLTIREQRDESLRLTEYVGTTAVGNGILKNTYAVRIKATPQI